MQFPISRQEGVGKCVGVWERWEEMCGCKKVGGGVEGVEKCTPYGECGLCEEVCESVLGCGEMCGEVWEELTHFSTPPPDFFTPPTLTQHLSSHFPSPSTLTQHLSPTHPTLTWHLFPHSPHTSPHSLTLPHTFFTSSHTSPPQSPDTSSSFHRISLHTLPHNPHSPHHLQNFSILLHTYFIIYPTPKFITFLIYCQISLAIKCTNNSL